MKQFSLRLMAALIAIMGLVVNGAKAQAPQAVPYQAVVRNASGNAIANKTVALRFSIRDAAATGTVVYQERQSAITNALGLFSVNVGQGTVATGTFSGIDWAGNTKFLQIEVDTTGGTTYISMGTQQLLSVPYALNAKKSDSASNGVPVGSVQAWMGDINKTSIPNGWLECSGSAISRTTYSNLYNVLGTSCGTGDGSTTFNLPNLRGKFLRGVDIGGAGNDPDASSRTALGTGGNTGNNVGSYQADAFQGHWHNLYFADANYAPGTGWGNVTENAPKVSLTQGGAPVKEAVTDGVNGTPKISSETRPKNVSVTWIIKY